MSKDIVEEMIRGLVESSITNATAPINAMADQLDVMVGNLRYMRLTSTKCGTCDAEYGGHEPRNCQIYKELGVCKFIKE